MRKRLLAMLLTMCLLINIAPSVFAVDQSTSKYSGKIISIMGDSISTFSGQPHSEKNRYPEKAEGSGVETVDDTWWMQLINELDATLGICEARGSSTVTNIYDEMTSDGRKGPTIAMASWERIKDLSANGTPDVILFYGGTNDKNAVYRDSLYEMGTFDPETAPALENYDPEADTAIKWNNVVEGFVAAILRMKATYPNAELIALLPINGSSSGFNTEIKKIYDHYGITTVSLTSVTSTGLWDTLHPNAYGMDIITAEVKAVMLGETVEYPMNPNAQVREIPADAYKDTNLWPDAPDGGYYKGKVWNTKYKSITLPVTEGDEVYASSFQSSSVTGGTSNGIAVTYLKEGKVTQSIAPADVYAAYKANGYLTVPAGVDAISIPMWADDENAVVNILNLPESSEDDTSAEPEPIASAELIVTAPGAYAIPQSEISGTGYSGEVTWSPTVNGFFVADEVYAATIILNADTGYIFPSNFAVTVNGEAVTFTVSSDGKSAIGTTANFPPAIVPGNSHCYWEPDYSNLYSDTNLWPLIEQKDTTYYNGTTWKTHTQVSYSVTIPVQPGDRIYASSFETKAISGGYNNGIAVTFFYGDTPVKTLGTGTTVGTTNGEFTANGGYLIIPNGVNFISIPMWKGITNPQLYILTLPTRITSADLTIAEPVTEVAPITEFSGTGYTGEIIWSPEVSGTFDAKTIYTANITLNAQDNNKFTENFVVTVNGEAADFTVSNDGKIASGTVAFAETEEVPNSHLQWVDDETGLYSDTNLWTVLEPKKEYHTGTNWRYNHATVYSVTIPIKEGDRIYASSFQARSANGGTSNGIAVAYFYGNKVISSLTPEQTYAEYSANGYITVPAGVNAVCIPVWNNDDNAVVNLLTLPDRPATKGEISGDGEVDETDAMILARYLAGWSGYEDKIVSMEAADLNGDGKVSDIDAMILARYLAGWPNYDEYFK